MLLSEFQGRQESGRRAFVKLVLFSLRGKEGGRKKFFCKTKPFDAAKRFIGRFRSGMASNRYGGDAEQSEAEYGPGRQGAQALLACTLWGQARMPALPGSELSKKFSFHRNLLPDNRLYERAGKTPRPRCHPGPPPAVGNASGRMMRLRQRVYITKRSQQAH